MFPSVHQSLHSDFVVGAPEGHAPPSLSGRLVGHCGVEDPSAAALGSGSPVVQGFGDCCQLGEVQPPAIHSRPVCGNADRHAPRDSVPVCSSSDSFSGSDEFLPASSVAPARMWEQLLGHMASLEHFLS